MVSLSDDKCYKGHTQDDLMEKGRRLGPLGCSGQGRFLF